MRWESDHPGGAVCHGAWFAGDGIKVADVWDSQERFECRLHCGSSAACTTG